MEEQQASGNHATEQDAPLWELQRLTKLFPGVRAVDELSMQIFPGEIHGLLGENGSGKSTLVKCLSGVHQPTAGNILYRGDPVTIHDPMVARALGIATIFQELSLVPSLSVGENIYLGRLRTRGSRTLVVDWGQIRRDAAATLDRLGIKLEPGEIVENLSVAEQQMVEIAKALSQDARLLIMDEPTAAIGLEEIERLHDIIRTLAQQGYAVIYISHRLDEVVSLVDRVTVMKDGRVVGERRRGNLSVRALVGMMIGSDVEEHYPKEQNATDKLLLSVEALQSDNGVRGVSFTVHRGEVFGLAGLIGTGRTEIAQGIFGIDSVKDGTVTLHTRDGAARRLASVPGAAIKAGIALLTEDRKATGLFTNFSAIPNISIAKLPRILRRGLLDLQREHRLADSFVEKLRITRTAVDRSVQFLSGGNQQKVIIARWMFSEAELFILDEPTQGIDVGAKVEVYNLINELTRAGKGVILISSEFEELLAMSDRIGIVNRGQIIDIRDAREIDKQYLMENAFVHQLT